MCVFFVCLFTEVIQPSGGWSSHGSCSTYVPDHQVNYNAAYRYEMTTDSQSPMSKYIQKTVLGNCVLVLSHTSALITCPV